MITIKADGKTTWKSLVRQPELNRAQIAIFVLLVFLPIFHWTINGYENLNSTATRLNGLVYNWNGSGNTHPIKIAHAPPKDDPRTLKISFEFLIGSEAFLSPEINRYQDIFETSAHDQGARLEYSVESGLNSRWAIVLRTQTGELKGIDLGRVPVPDLWNRFDFEVQGENIKLWINGNLRVNRSDLPFSFRTDGILIGNTTIADRPFIGTVKNFSIITNAVYVNRIDFYHFIYFIIFISFLVVALRIWENQDQLLRLLLLFLCISFTGYLLAFLKRPYLENLTYMPEILASFAVVLCLRGIYQRLKLGYVICFSFLIFALVSSVGLILVAGRIYLKKTHSNPNQIYTEELGAIFQSSPQEAFEFFWTYFDTNEQVGILFGALLFGLVVITSLHLRIKGISSLKYLGAATFGSFIAFLIWPLNGGLIATGLDAYQEYYRNVVEFRKYADLRKNFSIISATKKEVGETYVIVIGESASRDHFSSYGYFRKTTPWLDSLVGKQNWIFQQKAYASFTHTIPSLMKALTQSNQYNEVSILQAPSLIEVFNAAGFKTYWVSEQGQASGDTVLNALAAGATKTKYVQPITGLDAALDSTIASVDPKSNNLIVIHLLGSHADYRKRVPNGYLQPFSSSYSQLGEITKDKSFLETILNPYDTSIHYSDGVIKKIYEKIVAQVPDLAIFVYFSDHGEDVFGRKFHNSANFTYSMARIPFVIGFSDHWIDRNRERFDNLNANRDRIYTLDLFFEFMIGSAGIRDFYYDVKFDLGHEAYQIDETNALTMRADKDFETSLYTITKERLVSDDPKLIKKANAKVLNETFPGRFLSVHNDVVAKLYETAELGLQGAEFNVTVPIMKIGHYPEVVTELSLKEYLSNDVADQLSRLWIDTKQISGMRISDALDEFERLDARFNLKSRALIESWEPGIISFSNAGWSTVYYIQESQWPECKSFTVNLHSCAVKIAEKVDTLNVSGISFHSEYYQFVKTYLEPLLNDAIGYHSFGLPSKFSLGAKNLVQDLFGLEMVKDDRVKTILIETTDTF